MSKSLYRILSALISYPQADLIDALPEIGQALQADTETLSALQPLLARLQSTPLIALQEAYVESFDRTHALSLHLFEHIHGESRDRGQAMVDLLDEYRRHGFEPRGTELPDYVPLFLEFLGELDEESASALLGEAIHVLAAIGTRLQRRDSPYAPVLLLLTKLTDVVPREQDEPPVRDMDEAMEVFGPGVDGVEPLLKPTMAAVQTMHFHPRASAAHAGSHPAVHTPGSAS